MHLCICARTHTHTHLCICVLTTQFCLCNAYVSVHSNRPSITHSTHPLPAVAPPPQTSTVNVHAMNKAGTIRVTWKMPTTERHQIIIGYNVQYRRMGSESDFTSIAAGITESYLINKLDLGTLYEVRVATETPTGISAYCCGEGKVVMTYNGEL